MKRLIPSLLGLIILFAFVIYIVPIENSKLNLLMYVFLIVLIFILIASYVSTLFSETWTIELPLNTELLSSLNSEITKFLDVEQIEYKKVQPGLFMKNMFSFQYHIKHNGKDEFQIMVLILEAEQMVAKLLISSINEINYGHVMKVQSKIVDILNRLNYKSYQ